MDKRTCVQCAASFAPRDPRQIFCSKSCNGKACYMRRRDADPLPLSNEGTCETCGSLMPARKWTGPPARYCSDPCRRQASEARARVRRRELRQERKSARPERKCPTCEGVVPGPASARQIFCSRRCSKRMQNAGRRARIKGAFVEDLHWRMVSTEDGPACHICGYDVDPGDVETLANGARAYGPSYPTLDHVVALHHGGLHERANVKLAHFYCNSVKGVKRLEDVA